jgi:hypothetical protein
MLQVLLKFRQVKKKLLYVRERKELTKQHFERDRKRTLLE